MEDGKVYTVQVLDSLRIWVFEYRYETGEKTSHRRALCIFSNGSREFFFKFSKRNAWVCGNEDISWIREANENEIHLLDDAE